MYDSVDNLGDVAKLAPAALGYSMLVRKKGSVPADSMISEVFTEDHIKGMTHENRQETDLVLHSIVIVLFVSMAYDHGSC